MQDVCARRSHVFREDLSRHVAARILGHGKKVEVFLLEMECPGTGLGLRPGGHMQREGSEEQFEFFIHPAAEHHSGLSEVQIKIHEHGAEIRGTEQRVAPPHEPTFDPRDSLVRNFAHGWCTAAGRGNAWPRHQRMANKRQTKTTSR